MTDLETLEEHDSEIHEIVEEFMPRALPLMKAGPIPKTVTAFLSFIASTNFIKSGILDLIETDNTYSVNILFRTLIEHFLRFQYIWFRVNEEKNDSAGAEYLKFCSYREGLLIGKSWKRVGELLENDSDLSVYDALKESVPGVALHSEKEIKEGTAQFDLGHIILYIAQKLELRKHDKQASFLLSVIPTYCDLSFYVHGSPGVNSLMAQVADETKRRKCLLNTATIAFDLAASVKTFSLVTFCQYDKSFSQPYLRIEKLRRSIHSYRK